MFQKRRITKFWSVNLQHNIYLLFCQDSGQENKYPWISGAKGGEEGGDWMLPLFPPRGPFSLERAWNGTFYQPERL